jgi:Peptidase family M23
MRRLLLVLAAQLIVVLLVAAPARAAWVWPLHGEVITPYRNGDDPYAAGQHRGIDIAGAVGAPVVAAAGGEVRFAGTAGSSGLTVSVRTSEGYDTSYLHLSSLAVRTGERVSAGGRIGAVGTSGTRSAEAPHLHFGVREAGERHAYLDPLAFLPPPAPGAPDGPSPAPAPAPVPVAPPAVPVPMGAPALRRVPAARRVPSARRIPVGGRVPARRRVPVRPRVPAGRPLPGARRVPAARPVPAAPGARVARPAPDAERATAPRPLPGDARESAGRRAAATTDAADLVPGGRLVPGLGEAPGATASAPASAGSHDDRGTSHAERRARAGPDLGWVIACAGLLLAAAILVLNGDGRQAGRRGGARLAAAIRPLLGRR